MRKKYRFIFVMLLLCVVTVLVGCKENKDDTGEYNKGVYYERLSEVHLRYTSKLGNSEHFTTLKYDGRMYTATDMYRSVEKHELPSENIIGEELATVYGNNGICWSTDKDDLAGVTDEAKIYKVNGYEDDFRVCIYYENYVEELENTFYTLYIFDCVNGIYLDKGSELYSDRLKLSDSTKVASLANTSTKEFMLSMDDENVMEFLNALYDGVFIASNDEKYPELGNVNSCRLRFYDEVGLATDIYVYENGYVTQNILGQGIMTVKVDERICREMMWSWNGTYRGIIVTNIDENNSEELSVKLEVIEKDLRNIQLYVKKITTSLDNEGGENDDIILNNTTDVVLDMDDIVIFSIKESPYVENPKDVYVELKRESGEIIYFRYAESKEDLENNPYIVLKRSDY